MNAATKIKEMLEARRWTMGDLAREIGVTPQAIWAIVNNRARGATGRYSVARALGTTVSELWPEEEERARAA